MNSNRIAGSLLIGCGTLIMGTFGLCVAMVFGSGTTGGSGVTGIELGMALLIGFPFLLGLVAILGGVLALRNARREDARRIDGDEP